MKILLINGPNLQLLGKRETTIYGTICLADIVNKLRSEATVLGHELLDFQSNHEGDIVDKIGENITDGVDAIIINPAAYTHTSIAIKDALKAVNLPTVEVHLSNIHARESFRSCSMTASESIGVIAGFGAESYSLALIALDKYMKNK